MMETVPPTPDTPPLDYVQPPPLPFVGRHRKKLIFLALFAAVAIPMWRYWEPLKHRVLWLYWSRAAAAHVMPAKPADLLVSDPAAIRKTLAANPDFIAVATRGAGAAYWPVAYRELSKVDPRLPPVGLSGDALAFMGTLHRPDGTVRFVAVTGCTGLTAGVLYDVSVRVIPTPAWRDPPPTLAVTGGRSGFGYSGPPPTMTRLKSGTRDPKDPTHLIFEFEIGPRGSFAGSRRSATQPWIVEATGIIDAFLKNDDSMAFSLRSVTGTSLNVRIGHDSLAGDPMTIQAQAAQRAAAATQPATRPARSGRGRSP
jgi:hypothetical protein